MGKSIKENVKVLLNITDLDGVKAFLGDSATFLLKLVVGAGLAVFGAVCVCTYLSDALTQIRCILHQV